MDQMMSMLMNVNENVLKLSTDLNEVKQDLKEVNLRLTRLEEKMRRESISRREGLSESVEDDDTPPAEERIKFASSSTDSDLMDSVEDDTASDSVQNEGSPGASRGEEKLTADMIPVPETLVAGPSLMAEVSRWASQQAGRLDAGSEQSSTVEVRGGEKVAVSGELESDDDPVLMKKPEPPDIGEVMEPISVTFEEMRKPPPRRLVRRESISRREGGMKRSSVRAHCLTLS
jgi:hypothetical protein